MSVCICLPRFRFYYLPPGSALPRHYRDPLRPFCGLRSPMADLPRNRCWKLVPVLCLKLSFLFPASGERFTETLPRPHEVVLWPSGPHGTFYREVVAQGWDRFPSSDFHFAPCLRGALQRRSFLEILSLSELWRISALRKEFLYREMNFCTTVEILYWDEIFCTETRISILQ